jgi:hypothetical protein
MLGQIPKGGTLNYALVDKVVVEPSPDASPRVQILRVQISGVFLVRSSGRAASYEPPQRGYLHVTFPVSQTLSGVLDDWRSAAGKRQIVGFYRRNSTKFSVRPPDETPNSPDVGFTSQSPDLIRPDTQYLPVKSLLAFR